MSDTKRCPDCFSKDTGPINGLANNDRRRCHDCSKVFSIGPTISEKLQVAEAQLTAMTEKYDEAKQDAQEAMDTMDEAVRLTKLANERAEKARAQLAEKVDLQLSFDLRWKADERAISAWQAETGKELVVPDHADLCVWLMKRAEKAEAERDKFFSIASKRWVEITRLRKACKALLDGLDDCWVTTPEGQQAVMDAKAALSAKENTDG